MITVKGATTIARGLGRFMPGVKKRVRAIAQETLSEIEKATPVDTGALKGGWSLTEDSSGGFTFENPVHYAGYVDAGSRPGHKPWPRARERTVWHHNRGGRIYSSQAPGGILYRVKLTRKLETGIKDVVYETIGKLSRDTK